MLLVSVVAVSPQPSPLMKILIKPGAMSETIGKGVWL
jgi:hypothetical protein